MKITATEQMPILALLLKSLRLSSTTKARKLLKHGFVQIDGQMVVRADEMIEAGQVVEIIKKNTHPRTKPPFEILYDDQYVLIAVKPAGILSVNRENENSKTFHKLVNAYVREISEGRERAFLVHRLDREVSGVMIFAKSLDIQKRLEDDWRNNDKLYYALVEGTPKQKEGKIESWLAENSALKVYSTTEGPNTKHAISHYRVLSQMPGFSLVEVRLETGRKNQIRVHLSDLGCPIVGDVKYGAKSDPIGRIALHAFRFAFNHPVSGERVTVEAPWPKELEGLIKRPRTGSAPAVEVGGRHLPGAGRGYQRYGAKRR